MVSSSLRAPNQLSCIVSISRLRRDFCSSESFEIHFSLSKFDVDDAVELEPEDEDTPDEAKNEVIARAFLGVVVGFSTAFRLIGPDIVEYIW